MSSRNQLDLDILPEEARKEIEDFYEFLLKKYGVKGKKSKKEGEKEDIDQFFDKYNLDLNTFKFNRNKIHER